MCTEQNADQLQRFCEEEAQWLQSVSHGEAVYCIPPEAVRKLASRRERRAPLIDEAAAARGRRFWEVCQPSRACGLYGNRPIFYPCLWEPYGLNPEQLKKIVYPVYGDILDTDTLTEVHAVSWERLKGYAGWLMTDPDFIRERDDLRAWWESLPEGAQPRSPFDRTSPLQHLAIEAVDDFNAKLSRRFASRLELTKAKGFFLRALGDFLRRWNLCEMTTWDLPLPFGPFLAGDVWKHTQAIPEHCVQLILPVHYPLTTSDALLAVIREKQRQVAEERGLSPEIAALPHHSLLGQMFRVQHIEQTIRSRYAGTGLVATIELAVAAALGLSLAQTEKLRKAVSACRRGKRNQVPWLKVSYKSGCEDRGQ